MMTTSPIPQAKRSQSFHDYWFGLSRGERDIVIAELQTSDGYMKRLALGWALPGTPFVARLGRITGLTFWQIVRQYEDRHGQLA